MEQPDQKMPLMPPPPKPLLRLAKRKIRLNLYTTKAAAKYLEDWRWYLKLSESTAMHRILCRAIDDGLPTTLDELNEY